MALAREGFGRFSMKKLIVSALFCASAFAIADRANSQSSSDWPFYGYDSGSTRFSPLRQITPANVSHLKLAWTYDMRPAGVPKPETKCLGPKRKRTGFAGRA